MECGTIPIEKAKSVVSLTAAGDSYPGVQALEFSGDFRAYNFCFGTPAHTELKERTSHVFLNPEQRERLAYLLENTGETFNPIISELALSVSNGAFMTGSRPAQMQDLKNGTWGTYGISVFRGNDKSYLYAKYDSGGACDGRELYDTAAVLDEGSVRNLVSKLRR
ncbi:MAG: hypothetical protein HZB66_01130 [Candidatus Aenigmarchaeota archaeon]|nr:hypothetical protein [Candidatus Aenigmarchaeota archaeon]